MSGMTEMDTILAAPQVGEVYRHQCSIIPDGPSHVQQVLNSMQVTTFDDRHAFYDRRGRSVSVPRGERDTPYFDDGYAKALWDYRNDSLALGEDDETIFVRDVDYTGENRLLDSWHAISSLESEYHIKKSAAYQPWNTQLIVEARKLPIRVKHGIKFLDRAFYREDGQIVCSKDPDVLSQPFELSIPVEYDAQLAAQAVTYLRDVTVDDHSAENLGRIFATPLLEPYKHLTYIMYGDGGNGKGILLNAIHRSFPDLAASVDSQKLLGGRRGSGGFSTDQEALKLISALWAYDEDADVISLEQMTLLKKISTGDTLVARRIQENAVTVKPHATFIIATNNPVVTTMTVASSRRFAFVRMRDGRKAAEFTGLLDFIREYGIYPFIMSSCMLWFKRGDEPYRDIAIGSIDDLSEAEQWLVDQICEQGYAVSGLNPFKSSHAEHINSVVKLGLRTSTKKINGKVNRILTVKDELRFSPYRASWQTDQDRIDEESRPVVMPEPIEADNLPSLDEIGFACDYVPAGGDKIAHNWQRKVADPTVDTARRPDSDVYGVVPRPGFMVLDMDTDKTGKGSSGWQTLQETVGQYGSDNFPRTYLVRTPSGGAHAYYQIPAHLQGRLLNKVKAGGIPVDLRVEGKGYVIGAGSRTDKGVYQIVDVPDKTVPLLSDALCAWLVKTGCVEGLNVQYSPVIAIPQTAETSGTPLERLLNGNGSNYQAGAWQPDLTPIPEGERNTTLHDWLYGRLSNHPENLANIVQDFYTRGANSGLPEKELTSILRSVIRSLHITAPNNGGR